MTRVHTDVGVWGPRAWGRVLWVPSPGASGWSAKAGPPTDTPTSSDAAAQQLPYSYRQLVTFCRLVSVKWCLIRVLIFISLITNESESLFIYLLAIPFSVKYLPKFLTHFKNQMLMTTHNLLSLFLSMLT